MLIEQLLHGLESRDICDEIIAKKPETFNKSYEIASTLEAVLSVKIDGVNIEMELDSAAPNGIVNLQTMRAIKKNFRLLPTGRQFSDYSGHLVYCMGRVPVNVTLGSKTCRLNLYVVDGNYGSLFGRSWTEQFVHEIDFVKLFSGSSSEALRALSTRSAALSADQSNSLGKLLSRYNDIFSDTAGKLSGPPAKVHLKADARPIFAKAHDVPYALRETYKKEYIFIFFMLQ